MGQKICQIAFATVVLCSCAQAKMGTWHDVEGLGVGTPILVRADKSSVECVFQKASDESLQCQFLLRHRFVKLSRNLNFDRRTVAQVSRVYFIEGNGAVGALIGGGTGAAIGGASSRSARTGAAVVFGSIGAVLGAECAQQMTRRRTVLVYER